MSDPVTSAKTARESLQRALAALQSDPSLPPHLLDVAQPVSQAMQALFQIERSGGANVAEHGPAALAAVQQALGLLQAQPPTHAAVNAAMEAVAGSLGLVFGLSRAQAPAPAPQAAPVPVQAPAPAYVAPAPAPAYVAPAPAPAYVAPAPAPTPAYAPPAPQGPIAAPQFQPPPGAYSQPPPAPASHVGVPSTAPIPAPVAISDGIRVDAELGTHSPSNFYKGLSGNDIVEHGGVFVATYNIPRIGQKVALHVTMPGGYEFEAVGVVRWSRETVDSGAGAPPGFGAQFTHIAPEARQLIYRYVRNREPLFHDDL